MKAVWHSPIVGKLSPGWLLVTEIHVKDFWKIYMSVAGITHLKLPKTHLAPNTVSGLAKISKETRIFHLPWANTVEMAKGEHENEGGGWRLARERMEMAHPSKDLEQFVCLHNVTLENSSFSFFFSLLIFTQFSQKPPQPSWLNRMINPKCFSWASTLCQVSQNSIYLMFLW